MGSLSLSLLVGLLALRFALLVEPLLLRRPASGRTVLVVVLGTYLLTILLARRLWESRSFYHLSLLGAWRLVLWGMVVGSLWAVLYGAILCWAKGQSIAWSGFAAIHRVLIACVVQLCIAAALEEPLFRGFLWGFLRGRGWREDVIWFSQAALFFAGHAYYAAPGLWWNWAGTFACALVFGALAWRTRSIIPGMIAHALTNGIVATMLFGVP